jgi:hypothetical protein
VRKTDIGSQVDSAGFDYYLRQLDKRREEANVAIQLDLLKILANSGGVMRLYDLIAKYLRGEVTGDDWLELTSKIKRMQEIGLVSVVGVKGEESSTQNLRIKLSDIGKRTLMAQNYFVPEE